MIKKSINLMTKRFLGPQIKSKIFHRNGVFTESRNIIKFFMLTRKEVNINDLYFNQNYKNLSFRPLQEIFGPCRYTMI